MTLGGIGGPSPFWQKGRIRVQRGRGVMAEVYPGPFNGDRKLTWSSPGLDRMEAGRPGADLWAKAEPGGAGLERPS